MKSTLMSVCLFVCFSVCLSGVGQAEFITSEIPEFTFNLTGAKNTDHKDQWDGFQFTFSALTDSETGRIVGTQLTFSLTQAGIDAGYAGGKDPVKFKDFELKINGVDDLFKGSTSYKWDNGGWASNDTGTSINLMFADGISWDDFAALIANGDIEILAHLQSIGANNNSINDALFTYTKPEENDGGSTPEPASLLIFGIGAVGLGLLRKKK
ncbi:MAG: PEP-CTERM sorting domain-containing protein [Planctomycetaceae bacterium]|nr:PEP-CTERM sorting domain-containing protein [Planctomycetaceae bacterium]